MKQVDWLSPRRFAEQAGLPLSTVYHYVRGGRIRHIRRGGRIWINADLLRYGDLLELPGGVAPRRYRDSAGQLLPGVEVPRSELLWGTAAVNVERSIAVANGPDDLRHADAMPTAEVLVEADRAFTHWFLH